LDVTSSVINQPFWPQFPQALTQDAGTFLMPVDLVFNPFRRQPFNGHIRCNLETSFIPGQKNSH
jgi:hypothetical protein